MSERALVYDGEASHRVLRGPDGRVGNSSIGLAELGARDARVVRPEGHGGIEVQALVQVKGGPAGGARRSRSQRAAIEGTARSSAGSCWRTEQIRRTWRPRLRRARFPRWSDRGNP